MVGDGSNRMGVRRNGMGGGGGRLGVGIGMDTCGGGDLARRGGAGRRFERMLTVRLAILWR